MTQQYYGTDIRDKVKDILDQLAAEAKAHDELAKAKNRQGAVTEQYHIGVRQGLWRAADLLRGSSIFKAQG